MTRLLLIAAAVVCLAATAAPAGAAVKNFHSPSGNIQCEVGFKRPGIGTYAYCQTFQPARSVRMNAAGVLQRCTGRNCLGDGPEDAFTLGYGKAVVVGPYRCSSSSAGIRCVRTATGHGFSISRQAILAV